MPTGNLLLEQSTSDDGNPTLVVSGEIDLAVATRFAQALESIVERTTGTAVVDLSQVDFIDSSGIRELLHAKRNAELKHSELVLRAPSPQCRHVLEVSGALVEFKVRDS
jgi:anti-sigma B factor antagonist